MVLVIQVHGLVVLTKGLVQDLFLYQIKNDNEKFCGFILIRKFIVLENLAFSQNHHGDDYLLLV